MRIAVSSDGKDIKSNVSYVFGRCNFFVFADIEGSSIKSSFSIENEGRIARGGAGIRAVQIVGDNKADAVISFRVGPKAQSLLKSLGIKIYKAEDGSVEDNIRKFLDGGLEEI